MKYNYSLLKRHIKFLDNPEFIYFLGLLWADGHIEIKNYIVTLALNSDDFLHLKDLIEGIVEKSIKIYSVKCPTRNCKPIGKLNICQKDIHKFFIENDYHIKSKTSAIKILSKIPESLRHYWWRGYFDGDGYIDIKRKVITITSHIETDWGFCDTLNGIKYSIYKNTNKSRYSCFVIKDQRSFVTFAKFILAGDQFGLNRKHDKIKQIIKLDKERFDKKSCKYKNISYYGGGYAVSIMIKGKTTRKKFKFLKDAISYRNNFFINNGISIPLDNELFSNI